MQKYIFCLFLGDKILEQISHKLQTGSSIDQAVSPRTIPGHCWTHKYLSIIAGGSSYGYQSRLTGSISCRRGKVKTGGGAGVVCVKWQSSSIIFIP